MRDSKIEVVGFSGAAEGSKREFAAASRTQARARVTRAQLLDSARKVFARDGFEQARIEDIAKLSGKTRGAFYANFKDKEDVFFAIFEEDLAKDDERLRAKLRRYSTAEERVDALADFLAGLAEDRQRTLLQQEFKVYAIRHPRRRKRLAELHALMCQRCSFPEIYELLPGLEGQSTGERRMGGLAIGGVMDGLAISRLFDPEGLDGAQMRMYLRVCVGEALRVEEGRER